MPFFLSFTYHYGYFPTMIIQQHISRSSFNEDTDSLGLLIVSAVSQ